jgi:hypothetical protein
MEALSRLERVQRAVGGPKAVERRADELATETPKAPMGVVESTLAGAVRRDHLRINKLRVEKWLSMLTHWDEWASTKPGHVKQRCRKGIPDAVRGRAWLAMVGADVDPRRLARAAWYSELLRAASPVAQGVVDVGSLGLASFLPGAAEAAPACPFPAFTREVVSSIERDIGRTLPHTALFRVRPGGQGGEASASSAIGQPSLFRVLLALAASCPDVMYCQGMGFLAALWLCYVPEEDAFWGMYCMLQGRAGRDARFWAEAAAAATAAGEAVPQPPGAAPGGRPGAELVMRGLYEGGLPLLGRVQHVLVGLLHARLPRVAAAFVSLGIHPSMYCTQWAMTAFLYAWPFPTVVRVWDILLWEGWKGWFRIALAALTLAEKDLLAAAAGRYTPLPLPGGEPVSEGYTLSGFEGVMAALRDVPARAAAEPDLLIATATREVLGFSRTELVALEAEYDRIVARGGETCGPDAGACLGGRRVPSGAGAVVAARRLFSSK